MKDFDFGCFGTGDEGYAQYMTAHSSAISARTPPTALRPMIQTAMQTTARMISKLAPFCPFVHTTGKGGMWLEPDHFYALGLAVPGGLYRAGSSRGVFAAQAGKTGYPAHFVRNGGGHHVGGQRVEPVAAGHCPVAG